MDFCRLETSPGAPRYIFRLPGAALGSLRALPGRPLGPPGARRGCSKTLLGASRVPRGTPGGPRSDFGSILGAPGSLPGPILTRFWLCRLTPEVDMVGSIDHTTTPHL